MSAIMRRFLLVVKIEHFPSSFSTTSDVFGSQVIQPDNLFFPVFVSFMKRSPAAKASAQNTRFTVSGFGF